MSQITIERAVKTYGGGVTALHGIDLTIEDGELLVLVGPSGCGKSTLLRMIAGLESVTSGSIAIDGTVVNDMAPAQRDIAMVFQNYALYPHMTVRGNLEYGLKNRKVPASERRDLVDEAARILELTPYLDRKPSALSGGQRQRVAMGRAIVRKPRAFLFDEPLSNLDAKLRGHMRVEIRKLQRSLGTTSIFVTHDQLEAMTLADRLVVMKDGQIEQIGTPWEVYNTPATTFVARFIGAPGMNILERAQIGADAMPSVLASGKSLIGFRPEVAKLGWNGGALRFKGEIEGVEIIGPESLFHVRVPNAPDPLVVRLPTDPAGPMTGTISFEVEQENIRQFDH